MDARKRKAITDLLPAHTYDAQPTSPHIDAFWTTKSGRFSLVTAKWSSDRSWDTRVIVTALHNGENVTLCTEDPTRVREAIQLLGGIE